MKSQLRDATTPWSSKCLHTLLHILSYISLLNWMHRQNNVSIGNKEEGMVTWETGPCTCHSVTVTITKDTNSCCK